MQNPSPSIPVLGKAADPYESVPDITGTKEDSQHAVTEQWIEIAGGWPPALSTTYSTYACSPFKNSHAQTAEITIKGKVFCIGTASNGYVHGDTVSVAYTYSAAVGKNLKTANFTVNYKTCDGMGPGNVANSCGDVNKMFRDNLNVAVADLMMK